jgi:cobaltochelatase CobT
MNNNKNDLKEKFKQALISTAKVISDDYSLDIKDINKKIISKSIKSIDINDLSSKSDFTRLRAEMDSSALKKKFSDQEIYNKNLPNNSSCKLLYSVAERIRYEVLGGKMLKGIMRIIITKLILNIKIN